MSEKLETTITKYKSGAEALVIVDDSKFEAAGEDLKRAKTIEKEINDTFDPIIKKAHAAHKEAVGQKKKFTEPLNLAINLIKQAMITYKEKKDAEAREKQRKIDEENRKKAEDAKIAEAAELEKQGRGVEANAVLNTETVVAPAAVESAPTISGTSFRTVWKMRVIDPAQVPDDWKIVDEKGLAAFAKSTKGRVKVAGVEFYSEKTMAAGRG